MAGRASGSTTPARRRPGIVASASVSSMRTCSTAIRCSRCSTSPRRARRTSPRRVRAAAERQRPHRSAPATTSRCTALGDSIDLVAGYANVDSGVVQNLFDDQRQRPRVRRALQLRPATGGRARAAGSRSGSTGAIYNNDVVAGRHVGERRPGLRRDAALSLAYGGTCIAARARNSRSPSAACSNLPGGPDGNQAPSTPCVPARRSELHARPGELELRTRPAARLSGRESDSPAQYTGDELVPGEQFGIGGMDSVRGFYERQFSGRPRLQRLGRAVLARPRR